jgi:hypothetical protein
MSCVHYTTLIDTQNELYLLYYINWHLEWAMSIILYELTLRMSYTSYTTLIDT